VRFHCHGATSHEINGNSSKLVQQREGKKNIRTVVFISLGSYPPASTTAIGREVKSNNAIASKTSNVTKGGRKKRRGREDTMIVVVVVVFVVRFFLKSKYAIIAVLVVETLSETFVVVVRSFDVRLGLYPNCS